jgi:hypothetical protein
MQAYQRWEVYAVMELRNRYIFYTAKYNLYPPYIWKMATAVG